MDAVGDQVYPTISLFCKSPLTTILNFSLSWLRLMDFYKEKIQSDGSLDKLKLRIVVRGDFQNKEMVG